MDFLFLSMPYSKFDSRWFACVPNINLGLLEGLLSGKGRTVKAYHFHMAFEGYLQRFKPSVRDIFIALSAKTGVEFLGLDYVFASLLFEKDYQASRDRFKERLGAIGLDLETFEELREAARGFVDSVFSQIAPLLGEVKLVGFSCSHYQLSGSLLLCKKIKEANPNIRTVFGGKDCSGAFASELVARMNMVDFVGVGECEVTIVDLLEHLDDHTKPLVNVVYRNGSAGIERSPLKKNISVRSIPFPRYDFTDIPVPLDDVILPLEFGRGCPWGKCTFCPDPSYHITCQSKTAEQIEREIQCYCEASDSLRNFIILDSDALKDPDLILSLSAYFKGKGLFFHFAEFRAERMNRKVLSALSHFGGWVSSFQVGIETFSDSVLTLMNKGVSALKNVEVIKGAVELGVPLQFNLFTCYPNMTWAHMEENLRVMDQIAHLLVSSSIEAFPGEFYLPTDCPVFLNIDEYKLQKNHESIFADVFENFPMPSYSNYPYPYAFENDEEQFEMAGALRAKVQAIKEKNPDLNFICHDNTGDGLRITTCCEGERREYKLNEIDKKVYVSALEASKNVEQIARELDLSYPDLKSRLMEWERNGLILFSPAKDDFLSLATAKTHPRR